MVGCKDNEKVRILVKLIFNLLSKCHRFQGKYITISHFSAPIREKGHYVLNKLNRRVEHTTGFRSNSSRYESEDILVSMIVTSNNTE